jgi:intein-encoded DNA endonuclease-like protein
MGTRGPKPKSKVNIAWSANFAYAIGLIATDGCLIGNGRSIELTSNDLEQLFNFLECLGIDANISMKKSGTGSYSYRVQFSDYYFWIFLNKIGINQKKSLTIGRVDIPEKFFMDFLRGCLDGDGTSYSYWDKRWRSSYMFYVSFASGSLTFILWLKLKILEQLGIKGHIKGLNKAGNVYQLCYSKYEAQKLAHGLYDRGGIALTRKKLKIIECLDMIGNSIK